MNCIKRGRRALHFPIEQLFSFESRLFESSRYSRCEGTFIRRKWIREWFIVELGRIQKLLENDKWIKLEKTQWSEAVFPDGKWCEFWFELLNHNQARTWSRIWNWKFTDTWCRYCESFYNDNKRVSWSEGFSLSCLHAYDSNLLKYRN